MNWITPNVLEVLLVKDYLETYACISFQLASIGGLDQ